MRETIKRFIKNIVRIVVLIKEDIQFETDQIDQDQGPFLFLSNHVTNWDPFYLNAPIHNAISYVCSERFFRIWPLGPILRYVDAIPKTKNKSDMMAIRHLVERKKRGLHIGIFAEGRRNWDGHTESIFFSTAKLVKLLKMPVVAVNIQGGNLSYPRWSDNKKRGRITLTYTQILTSEEIESMNADQIFERITEALEHREEDSQKQALLPYRGKKRAESLERLLFLCPECCSYDSLHSKGHELTCEKCGYQVLYTETGFLEMVKGQKLHYNTVSRWNDWQKNSLKEEMEERLGTETFSKKVLVKTFDKERNLKGEQSSDLKLSEQGLYLEGEWFEMNRVSGVNIQSNDMLEFYTDDTALKRIHFTESIESVYKWSTAIDYLKNGG